MNEVVPLPRVPREDLVEGFLSVALPAADPEYAKAMTQSRSIDSSDDYQSAVAMTAAYIKVVNTRKNIFTEVDRIKNHYLADAIISQIVEDALSPDISTGDILSITYSAGGTNEDSAGAVQTAIDELDDLVKFDRFLLDIAPDILLQGEYTLRQVVKKGEGIVDVLDDVNQESVVAVTKNGEINKFLVISSQPARGQLSVEEKDPTSYVKFILPGQKIRVDLRSDFSTPFRTFGSVGGTLTTTAQRNLKKIPMFLRIGRSVLFPVLSKIKELELLEQMVPAGKLAQLQSGTVLGVTVAAGADIKKGFETAQQIEQLLNQKVGVDQKNKQLTIENILSAAKLKVIPIFGDKGQLQKFDYKQEEPSDLLTNIVDIRKCVCNSIGVPYELLYGGESGDKKGELLRRYSRYLRRLRNLQAALAYGVELMVTTHLVNKEIKFDPSKIKVDFRQKLVEIDLLDRLEFVDTSTQVMTNIFNFVSQVVNDPTLQLSSGVKREELMKYFNKQLEVTGLSNVFSGKLEPLKIEVPPTAETPPKEVPSEEEPAAGEEEPT